MVEPKLRELHAMISEISITFSEPRFNGSVRSELV